MKIVAYCPKSGTIVLKMVLPNELLCLHCALKNDTDCNDRMEELKEISDFLEHLQHGKLEFSEIDGIKNTIICFDDYEIYISIGILELHKDGKNIMIDFKHNRMFRYDYDQRDEMKPYDDIDIRTICIH
ncbi:MAG: hypothetical protein LKG25_04655 [Prevotella sp.]|jgi:hypothetical protein|nr:hypothetical protein [Prevotella sp.]